jgi:hypothetical protein
VSQVINGVTVQEIVTGFSEEIPESGGPRATKSYLVPNWADRFKVANGVLGFVASPPTKTGAAFTLSRPRQYEESPNLYARSVSIRPVGKPLDGSAQLKWTSAIVTVSYGVVPFGDTMNQFNPGSPLNWATQEFEFGGEFLNIGAASCKLSDGTVVDQDQSIFVPHVNLALTLHFCPYLDVQTIMAASGKVNDATFLGAVAGYLRFNGARSRAAAMTDGTYTQEITFSFSYRQIARWDAALKPASNPPSWLQLQYKDGSPVVASTDLSALIPAFYYS